MSALLSLLNVLLALKIAIGVCAFACVPVFFFKLLTGRYSFLKPEGARKSAIGRALAFDAEFVERALEEVRQSERWERGADAPPPPGAVRHGPIVVTVAADGSFKVDIPNDAFELDGAAH